MKKGISILSVVTIFVIIWYLFIKQDDYTIRFTSNTFPETISQSIILWSNGLKNAVDLKKLDNELQLSQTLKVSDSTHVYHWQIIPITDSTSKVIVGARDIDLTNRLWNRIQLPFKKNNFTIGSEKRVYEFMEVLKDHVDHFRVKIIGIEDMPSKYIAYVPLQKIQYEKAKGMMENSSFIGQVLVDNNMQMDGPPMIEVTKWDRKNDTISYNFGYPIKPSDSLPDNPEIKYKKLEPKKGIKAIYNGNYITSDRAWYQLLRYAKNNNIQIIEQPLEVFHNNPDMGGDALKWKTEVYLPIVNKK